MSGSGKVKAFELLSKNKTDLMKQLDELKQELHTLKVQQIAGGSSGKVAQMSV